MSYFSKTKQKDFFNKEIFILKLAGLSFSDGGSFIYKVYSHIVFYIFNLLYLFTSVYSLHSATISENADAIGFNIGMCLGLTIIMTGMINRKKLSKLLKKLEEAPFLPDLERGGAEEETFIAKWFTLKTIQGLAFYVSIILFLGSRIVYTFIMNIVSDNPSDWKFAFGELSILNVTTRLNYEISWIYQAVSIAIMGIKICPIMIIMYGTLSYGCAQLQILQHYLRSLGINCRQNDGGVNRNDESSRQSNEISTKKAVSWEYLQPALKRAVFYHLKILEIISEVENIFSIVILITYFGMLFELCILMYAISLLPLQDPRTMTLLIAAGTMCGFPLPVCYWGEQISHESEEVAKAAYEASFVGADLRFQKGLILIIERSQRTVRIKAGKFVDTSMVTYGWLLRTALSYFMVIRNINMDV